MDPVCASSTNEHLQPAPQRRPIADADMCASPDRAGCSAGFASPSTSERTLDGADIRGTGREACPPSSQRRQVVEPPDMDDLQDSSEILAQWAQLIPDDAFEQCFQLDDLDSLLENCSGLLDFPNQPQFVCSSDSGTSENSETISQSVSVETRDDQTMVTTSSDSVGTSTRRSPGKRKCRERIMEAAGEPGTQPIHSMDGGGQGSHLRKRLPNSDRSTRYAIQTRTDVDIIDDGYRWRKYGQKPVKNSDHPRNYYRCTTPNCPVRKQVERCTENPRNVLATYDGKHNHPKGPSQSMRESSAGEVPQSTPTRPHEGFVAAAGLPPSNYMSHTLLNHMLTGALLDPRSRWPNAPAQGGSSLSQRNINLLRAQQLFMFQYQSQLPFFASMFNLDYLMHNCSLAQPPFLDPSLALLAAQSYGMRVRGSATSDRCTAAAAASAAFNQQQAWRSAAPSSRTQDRLLRMQELMGEKRHSGDVRQSQQQSEPTNSRGLGNVD